MSSFFSGTDMEELHDNTINFPMYLSLIVNVKEEYVAKLCYTADVETKSTFRGISRKDIDDRQNYYTTITKKDVLHTMNCKVLIEDTTEVDAEFEKRYNELKSAKKPVGAVVYDWRNYGKGDSMSDFDWEDDLLEGSPFERIGTSSDIDTMYELTSAYQIRIQDTCAFIAKMFDVQIDDKYTYYSSITLPVMKAIRDKALKTTDGNTARTKKKVKDHLTTLFGKQFSKIYREMYPKEDDELHYKVFKAAVYYNTYRYLFSSTQSEPNSIKEGILEFLNSKLTEAKKVITKSMILKDDTIN